MFSALFEELHRSVPGLKAVSVVGDDGIEVDGRRFEELPQEVLSAEMSGLLKTLKRLREEISLGLPRDLVIRTDAETLVLCPLQEGLSVLLVAGEGTPSGLARYHVQRLAHRFLEALQ
jgi:predicted regulator of Ras-like GTPase activity (Roadblock/LC7/MglB family)